MGKDDLEIFIDEKKASSPEFAENFEEGYLNFKIGVILRQSREEMGITQSEIAVKLNTTKSVISRMENHADDFSFQHFANMLKPWVKRLH